MAVFKIDMHVHTADVSSCAGIRAQDVPGIYRSAGYQGIVITDHYFRDFFGRWEGLAWEGKIDRLLSGYNQAKAAGDRIGLRVFLGFELRMNQDPNDYLIYGADRNFLVHHPDLHLRKLAEVKALADEHGLLIYQAHPFRYGDDVVAPDAVHGLEVFNGNISDPALNGRARDYARQNGLLMVSGSDFHGVNNLGKGGLELDQPVADNAGLIQALKKGDFAGILGHWETTGMEREQP